MGCEVLYNPGCDLSPELKAPKGKARHPPPTVMPQADDREQVDYQTGTVLALSLRAKRRGMDARRGAGMIKAPSSTHCSFT
jgi:hypothetical protein